MKAVMGTLLPRAFKMMGNPNRLDASLVPRDSSIRHLFEDDSSDNQSASVIVDIRVTGKR